MTLRGRIFKALALFEPPPDVEIGLSPTRCGAGAVTLDLRVTTTGRRDQSGSVVIPGDSLARDVDTLVYNLVQSLVDYRRINP